MKKGVRKEVLFFVSGIIWIIVGIMLNILSFGWFFHSTGNLRYLSLIFGFLAGFFVSFFGFNKIAKKNIDRILKLKDYTCVFYFQEIKSYFIIIFMITLGIFMRKSGFFSKEFLSFVYTTIGTALFLSGLLYFNKFIENFYI